MHNPVSQQKVGEPIVAIVPHRGEPATLVGDDHLWRPMLGKEVAQHLTELAATLRTQFIAQYGATKCQSVLEMLGPQENALKCKELTAQVAGMLAQLLRDKGFQEHD
jgi:hypothetical protein